MIFFISFLLLINLRGSAQIDTTLIIPRNFPVQFTESECFRSVKLDQLIKKNANVDFEKRKLSAAVRKKLSARDRLAYVLFYPESYFQSCSMPPFEKAPHLKLHAYFKPVMEGYKSSGEQRDAVMEKRDSAILIINQCLGKSAKTVTPELARTIVMLRAYECIPNLKLCLNYYQDTYIYSILMQLMVNMEYGPFKQTTIYHKLFVQRTDKGAYNTLPLQKRYVTTILEDADSFYKEKSRSK